MPKKIYQYETREVTSFKKTHKKKTFQVRQEKKNLKKCKEEKFLCCVWITYGYF